MSSFTVKNKTSSTGDLPPGNISNLVNQVASGSIVPGTPYELFDVTPLLNQTNTIASGKVTCSQPGLVEIFHIKPGPISSLVDSGRISVGTVKNFEFKLKPFLTIPFGESVKVFFTIHPWAVASDVEAYLLTSVDVP